VCISLCTTVIHSTAQNSSDNLPSLILQTVIIAQILSNGREGENVRENTSVCERVCVSPGNIDWLHTPCSVLRNTAMPSVGSQSTILGSLDGCPTSRHTNTQQLSKSTHLVNSQHDQCLLLYASQSHVQLRDPDIVDSWQKEAWGLRTKDLEKNGTS